MNYSPKKLNKNNLLFLTHSFDISMDNCIFCKIINKEITSYVVYEDDYVLAILPKDMEVYGHTLIIPKKHFINLYDIDEETLHKLTSVVKKITLKYKQTIGSTGVNILHASGKDAQQSVFHFHFHVFPRFENDGLNTWPKLEYIEEDKNTILQKLLGN